MEEVVSLPPMEFFNDDFQLVLDFIESLGNPKFKIAGGLNLYCNETIRSLGTLVEVKGYLSLSNTNITSLPDNLTVELNLILNNTKITSLPDNLTVGGSLFLYNTSISENYNYNREDIKKMIEDKGGFVKGKIFI